MKKIIVIIFVFNIIVWFNTLALEDDPLDITIMVGIEKVEFEDQKPIIKENRTLVPIRSIFEQMGARVLWNDEEKSARVEYGETVVLITIGDTIILKNNDKIIIDVPAEIINDRILLPLRAIAEALDWHVFWGDMSRTVSLYKFDEDYAHDLKLYEYIDKDYYVIKEFMPTEYGTVVYMILSGGPHGSDPMLKFVDTSGNEYNFYNLVPRLTPWIHPECNDLKLSEDNKILTYSVSLREHVIINITEYNILHEAGTYYFMANLETKQYERIAFEPIKK